MIHSGLPVPLPYSLALCTLLYSVLCTLYSVHYCHTLGGLCLTCCLSHVMQVSLNASDLEIQRIEEQDRLDEEMLDEMFKGLERDELQLRAADVNQSADIDEQTFSRPLKEGAQHEAGHEKKQREQLPQVRF